MSERHNVQSMLDRAMREKYCHSMGAALHGEGRLDEAIGFFEEALAIEEKAYTRRHLGLSLMAKNDLDRALAEMTRAIDLAPGSASFRLERSGLLRLRGETAQAEADYAQALRLDPDLGRIERIRSGERVLREAVLPGGAGMRSCIVPCPAYCCHFADEPVVHGVYIGPWKLSGLRRLFRERGFREEDFLGRLILSEEEHYRRLIPPDVVVKEKGRKVVFYPRRSARTIDRRLVSRIPMAVDYEPLSWITAGARPCAFLEGGRCAIHDVADEAALPACKEFFCLTGLVFLGLADLGLVAAVDIKTKGMGELNRTAVEVLIALSQGATPDASGLKACLSGREFFS